ncbi:MAG: hypothetical protein NTU53_10940 [Planctomycetota bacterium]|nr:hypothetical protein [Planctomycetota bacterium]
MSSTQSNLPDTSQLPAPEASQLQDLPKDELEALADELGLEVARYRTRQHLVAALHQRRQLIATLDRDAMLDTIRWARRSVPLNATNEQLAQEIVRVKSMRFQGLSQQGLLVLGHLRGASVKHTDDVPTLIRKLKKLEGFFSKLGRKQRGLIGSLVSNLLGEDQAETDYQFLPPQQTTNAPAPIAPPSRPASIKQEIEEAGLLGGIAGRIKKSADSYLNHKLDEIESRIDRKLDEIDRRLGEWRDKEIANRIRILKITLWASVIVAAFSLIYSYIKVYFYP